MDVKNLKLCVICCSAFSSASTVQSDAILCREHLVTFCKLLATSPPRQSPEFDALLQKSFPGMDAFFQESDMSICCDCNHQITVAMEKGVEAEKKEENVRNLQRQILEQMKDLQKEIDAFHEEMTKVEKVIQTSDVSCLMFHMAKNPTKNEDATNGIVLIRDRILDVMADLRDFQSRQNNILNFDLEQWTRDLIDNHPLGSVLNAEEEEEDEDFLPFFPQPDVIIGTEGLQGAGPTPVFFGHTIYSNEGDFRFEASAKNNGTKDDSDFSAEEADISEDSDVEEVPPPQVGPPQPPKKSAPAPPPQPPRRVVTTVPAYNFKNDIIQRALHRQQSRTPGEDTHLDPIIRHPLKYNATSDKLTVGPYEVLVDDPNRTMQCATCGFARRENKASRGSLDIEWKIRVHIVAIHIGFKCTAPGCSVQCSDHQQFLRHLKQKHSNDKLVQNKKQAPVAGTRHSTRNNHVPPPPPPPPKPSTSKPPPPSRKPVSNTATSRTCPVSACRKIFVKKEDFIRHLQQHRTQNKMQRSKKIMPGLKTLSASDKQDDSEPELVILD